ncbi:hypothetical protein B0A55_02246 [Friedmanniomyces simplex]|uniref:Mid2 domain-containing protein n=1 Tax=Friedmanniomyces simplex TaxID=329884 RepID=A0A4V5NHF9_9PEZI|nr:hypothetical protein B0A55_02246 [Friedmanniomyces simplex]
MRSSLLVHVCLPVWLVTSAAQEFVPLSSYSDYPLLQQCQRACLDDATSSSQYNNETTAQDHCGDLINQLKDVAANGDSKTFTEASVASVDVTGTIAGVSGPAATGDGGPGVTASTTNAPQTGTPSAGPATPSTLQDARKASGLTSGAKAGIGVGVGVGISLIIGAIAAWWFLSRRKKSRAAGRPYGLVMTSEKGRVESGSYSSPAMEPQEMHPMVPAAPFLPAVATRDLPRHEETYTYKSTPTTATSRQLPYSDDPAYVSTRHSPQPEHYSSPQERHAASRDVSRGGTPPALDTQARSATAHLRVTPPDDEPPSPVSPISPVGSRSASLRHDVEHDGL